MLDPETQVLFANSLKEKVADIEAKRPKDNITLEEFQRIVAEAGEEFGLDSLTVKTIFNAIKNNKQNKTSDGVAQALKKAPNNNTLLPLKDLRIALTLLDV